MSIKVTSNHGQPPVNLNSWTSGRPVQRPHEEVMPVAQDSYKSQQAGQPKVKEDARSVVFPADSTIKQVAKAPFKLATGGAGAVVGTAAGIVVAVASPFFIGTVGLLQKGFAHGAKNFGQECLRIPSIMAQGTYLGARMGADLVDKVVDPKNTDLGRNSNQYFEDSDKFSKRYDQRLGID